MDEQRVSDFKERVFSGYDLLHLMDLVGVGVGATLHAVLMAERDSERSGYRRLTFDHDLRVKDVEEALLALMAERGPRRIA